MPSLWAGLPFASLILAIAILPAMPLRIAIWWDRNRSKLLISSAFSLLVVVYYILRRSGIGIADEQSAPHWPTLLSLLHFAVLEEYLPFMILLLALYVMSGGVRITGDLEGKPITNTLILFLGAILANLIGTTGATMLMVRPMLQINSERRRTRHIPIFFIFIVSNIAGSLIPIGPPLFLGYLRGVPFFWTLIHLWPMTLTATGLLLVIHFIVDTYQYRHEAARDHVQEEVITVPFRFVGLLNLFWIALAVLAVATIFPGHQWLRTGWVPFPFCREVILLALTILAYRTTRADIRRANHFSFHPIAEIACLFLGIFVTLVPLIEWLNRSTFTVTRPWEYFWATGGLSAILDNAPTYAVFFELASHSSTHADGSMLILPHGQLMSNLLLTALSCGSVFFGGLTYIGNAPNFMVKRLAEDSGLKMPGFFRFMLYGIAVLVPIFVLITLLFFR